MLEKVKPGDLVIFSNEEQAKVTEVNITPSGTYDLYFNKPVSVRINEDRYDHWVFERNGTLNWLTGSEYISIVKIIAE